MVKCQFGLGKLEQNVASLHSYPIPSPSQNHGRLKGGKGMSDSVACKEEAVRWIELDWKNSNASQGRGIRRSEVVC